MSPIYLFNVVFNIFYDRLKYRFTAVQVDTNKTMI